MLGLALLAATALSAMPPISAERPTAAKRTLTAAQMFEFAQRAALAGEFGIAERALRALMHDPDMRKRCEARFRLAMILAQLGRLSAAALLLRQILDEDPGAQRIRLELARVLERMGDEAGARKALREAQAGGLPPDVARFVDRYSAALRARKRLGATVELALAPDSNINHATRSKTLGTVLGDFSLDGDARERSGIGLAARGQAYARARLSRSADLLARVSGSAELYRHGQFDDVAFGIAVGPEFSLGADRLTTGFGPTWRWYGDRPFSRTLSLSLDWLHPLGQRAQLRAGTSIGAVINRLNRHLGGNDYAATLSYERALSNRSGIGGSLALERQALRDPGYASTGGQLTLVGYRDLGAVTLIGSAAYGRLEADERLSLFTARRIDSLYRASIGATFRRLHLGEFALLVRITGERNRSNIGLYGYRRIRTEFGLTRAF